MTRGRLRRWVWALSGVLLAAVVLLLLRLPGSASAPSPAKSAPSPSPKPQILQLHSQPQLAPPRLQVTGSTSGDVFLAPKTQAGQSGPMITDGEGKLIWFHPLPKGVIANDFKVQTYRGQPVLTWWEGKTNTRGYGQGSWVIADASYREIARVRAGDGLYGDLHDMQLTDRATALITIYHAVRADLSPVGAVKNGHAVDSIIQEVDAATARVVFEWHSLDHVALTESHAGAPAAGHTFPYDYFHINSINVDADGNLLVSARNTWALYKIDRRTGAVLWRLGGLRSDFALGPGVRFAWQHDARRLPDGTITLFDNESTPKVGDRSRLLTLAVDERRRTVTLERALTHPAGLLADAEGNAQQLPNGHVFAGWGLARRASELDAEDRLLFDVRLPGDYDTYRAFRFDWTGRPANPPALAAARDGDRVTAYASWNGATGVARWQLLAGTRADALSPVGEAPSTGFETAIEGASTQPLVAVRALDASGKVLATSAAERPSA